MKDVHENSTRSLEEQKEAGRTEHFRKAIFDLLAKEKKPMTDRELMVALKEPDCNNVRPEVTRLKQDRVIEEVDKVKCQWTGKRVRRTQVAAGAEYRPRMQKGKGKSAQEGVLSGDIGAL